VLGQVAWSFVSGLLCRWMPAGPAVPLRRITKRDGFAAMEAYRSSGGPAVPLPAALARVVELVGGVAQVVGHGTRFAALALFSRVAWFFFHRYWDRPAAQPLIAPLPRRKNIAFVGGLLTGAAWGVRAWGVAASAKHKPNKEGRIAPRPAAIGCGSHFQTN
jgi:putative oxidoreductase